jgi:predicted ATPase
MITKIYLENFRAIPKSELELGKITVLTGPNNSGKSSVIYGLLALKNVVLNPVQSLDSFLNLGFLNLGGFSQTVHLKDEDSNIVLGIECSTDPGTSGYFASLGRKSSQLRLDARGPFALSLKLAVTFPYPANLTTGAEIKGHSGVAKVTWNGITSTIGIEGGTASESAQKTQQDISRCLNAPTEELRAVELVPLRRGFIKPNYSSVPMQQQLLTDDELATLLATDRDLEGKVAFYLEKIVDRVFSVRPTIGTANFYLQSRDRSTGFVSDLVNEGFGTNQLVTILAKSLRKDMRTICIEEPEIHLHPEMMDKLVDVLLEAVENEGKSFVIATHSEHIVISLLNKVAAGRIDPKQAVVYYLSKRGRKAEIERQEINDKGQMRGGLKAFYETELKQTKEFFQIVAEE